MYDPALNDGHWLVDVYAGRTRVDHKDQLYQPHGSISSKKMPPNSLVRIEAWHTDPTGTEHVFVPNGCTAHELARFLAGQLRGSLPDGIEIEAVRSDVVLRFDGLESKNGTASILDEDDGRSFVERLVTATDSVLSHVQDVAAEKSALPWPSTGASMPLPHVEVISGTLRACFGDPHAPVLALAKVDILALGG